MARLWPAARLIMHHRIQISSLFSPTATMPVARNDRVIQPMLDSRGPLPSMPFSTFAGNIAASTPSNLIVGKQGAQPYYTLDGGRHVAPDHFASISDWSRFMGPFFVSTRAIASDRVLPNTFYLLFSGKGIFKTSGANWTEVSLPWRRRRWGPEGL
jgi:hypothetical protein